MASAPSPQPSATAAARPAPNTQAGSRTRPPRLAQNIGFALACLFAGAVLVGMIALLDQTQPVLWDFQSFYLAGRVLDVAGGHRLYDAALHQQLSRALFPARPVLVYNHTPLEALLFWPLARLPFRLALLIWTAATLLVAAVALALLGRSGRRLAPPWLEGFAALALLYVWIILARGQDTAFLLLVVVAGLLLLQHRREGAAGAVLGLGLYRFELLLPFLAIFALRRRWRLVAGAGTVAALGLVGSWALVGTAGLRAYLQLLLASGQVQGGWNGVEPDLMPNLRGLLVILLGGRLPARLLVVVIALGSLALLVWAARCCTALAHAADPRLPLHYSLATAAALLASYHLFPATLVPLLLVAFVLLSEPTSPPAERWLVVALLLPWQLLLLPWGLGGLPSGPSLAVPLLGLLVVLARRARRAQAPKAPA